MTKADDEISDLKHRVTILEEHKISLEEHVNLKNDVKRLLDANRKEQEKKRSKELAWAGAWISVIVAGVVSFSKDIVAYVGAMLKSGPHP